MTTANEQHCCAPLMTPIDLATYLGVPLATVYAWRSRGQGPTGERIGKHLRYRRADVESWLDAQAS